MLITRVITLDYRFAGESAKNLSTTLVLRNTTLTYCFYTIAAKLPQHKQERSYG